MCFVQNAVGASFATAVVYGANDAILCGPTLCSAIIYSAIVERTVGWTVGWRIRRRNMGK